MTMPKGKKRPVINTNVNMNGKRRRYQKKGQKMYELDEKDFPDDPEKQKKIRQAKNARRQREQTQGCIEDKDRIIEELKRENEQLKERLRALGQVVV